MGGMARMDVLEQTVLRAIRRDEHRAGDIPLLLVEERAHRGRARAGERLEVVDELGRAVTKCRPGTAVDRPAEPATHVRRMTVGRPGGENSTAITVPRISGGGYVSGTFRSSVVFPASVSRCGQVGARMERHETGRRRAAPGRYSRMSKTPWPPR